jgi:hypothetical protein
MRGRHHAKVSDPTKGFESDKSKSERGGCGLCRGCWQQYHRVHLRVRPESEKTPTGWVQVVGGEMDKEREADEGRV